MLTTPHVLLGLYLALNYSPNIGLPAAFISHFLFDFFYPHWNPHLFTEMKRDGRLSKQTLTIIGVDTLTALGIIWYFLNTSPSSALLLAGSLLAILPDLIEIPYYFLKSNHPWLKKLIAFEHTHQARANVLWGSLSQVLVVGICLWGIMNRS